MAETVTLVPSTAYAGTGRDLADTYTYWLAEPLCPYMADFAVECWFTLGDLLGYEYLLTSGFHTSNDESGFRIRVAPHGTPDQFRIAVEDVENNYTEVVHSNPGSDPHFVADGTWYHMLLLFYHDLSTHNGFVKTKLYLDGTLWETETHTSLALNPITWAKHSWGGDDTKAYGCSIGANSVNGTGAEFSGKISRLRYWEYTPVIGGTDDINTLFDATSVAWLYNTPKSNGGRSLTDIEGYSAYPQMWTDLLHAWECTDRETTQLLDFKGENHGTEKAGPAATAPSVAATTLTSAARHNETAVKWTDSSASSHDFEWTAADTDSAPRVLKEIAYGQPGVYFEGAQWLQVAATTDCQAIHAVLAIEGQTWDGGGDQFAVIGYSDASSAQDYFWLGFNDTGQIVVASNDAGTERTYTGDSILPTTGIVHITYDGTTLRLNGVAETPTGLSATMPDDFTNEANLDVITLGAVEISDSPTKFLDKCCICELRDYTTYAEGAASLFTTSEATYGTSYYTSTDSLAGRVTAVGSDKATIYVDDAQALSAAVSCHANTHVRVLSGGSITTTASYTLTVAGSLWSDEDGWLTCGTDGSEVILSGARWDRIRADWFVKTTDDFTAVRRAVESAEASSLTDGDSKSTVYLDSASYEMTARTDIGSPNGRNVVFAENDVALRGKGRGLVIITREAGFETQAGFGWGNNTGTLVENITIDAESYAEGTYFWSSSSRTGNHAFRRVEFQNSEKGSFDMHCDTGTSTVYHCSCINQIGQHGFLPQGSTFEMANIVCIDLNLPGTGTGRGIDSNVRDKNTSILTAERFAIWGMPEGGAKTSDGAGAALVDPVYTETLRHGRFYLNNGEAWNYTQAAATTGLTWTQTWQNVWADGCFYGHDESTTPTSSTISLTDCTFDLTTYVGAENYHGLRLHGDQRTITLTRVTVTSPRIGLNFGSTVSGGFCNITATDLNLTLCSGTSNSPIYPHPSSILNGSLDWTGGSINAGRDAMLVALDHLTAPESFVITMRDVTLGSAAYAESGLNVADAGVTVNLYGCDTSDVTGTLYTKTAGTLNLGLYQASRIGRGVSQPAARIYPNAEGLFADGTLPGAKSFQVILVMDATTADTEDKTVLSGFTDLDEYDDGGATSRYAVTETWAGNIFDAEDLAASGTNGAGSSNIQGGVLATTDADPIPIAWIPAANTMDFGTITGGFASEFATTGIFDMIAGAGEAGVWTGAVNTNWSNAGNWENATVPTLADPVTFDGTGVGNMTLDTAPDIIASLTVTADYSGDIDLATYDLTIGDTGDVTLAGTGTFDMGTGTMSLSNGDFDNSAQTTFDDGTSTLSMSGTGTITSGATKDLYNLTIAADATVTSTSDIDTQGTVTVNGSLSIPTTKTLDMQGVSTLTIGDGATLTGAGAAIINAPGAAEGLTTLHSGGTLDITSFSVLTPNVAAVLDGGTYDSTSVKIYNTAASAATLTLKNESYSFRNLEFENTNAGGSLTIANNTNNPDVEVQNNLVLDQTAGTLTVTDGTAPITFEGSASQVVTSTSASSVAFDISKTAGALDFQSGTWAMGANAAAYDVSATTGDADVDLATYDLTLAAGGSLTLDGTGTFDAGSGTISIDGGTFDNEDQTTYDDGTSTLSFAGTSTLTSSGNLYNLTVASGTTTSTTDVDTQGTVTVTGKLSIPTTKTLDAQGTSTIAVGAAGSLAGDGTLLINTPGAAEGLTVTAGGAVDIASVELLTPNAAAVLSAGTYGNLKIYNTAVSDATWTPAAGTYTVTGDFEVENTGHGGSLTVTNSNNPDFVVQGDFVWDKQAGMVIWTKGTGSITLGGASSQNTSFGSHFFFDVNGDPLLDVNGDRIADKVTMEDIVIDKSAGTVTLGSDLVTDSLTHSMGTLDFDAKVVETTGNLTIGALGEIVTGTDAMNGTELIVGGKFYAADHGLLPRLNLRGTAAWLLTVTGTAEAVGADASYSDASGGTEVNSTGSDKDSGNNTNWSFGGGGGGSGTVTSTLALVGYQELRGNWS